MTSFDRFQAEPTADMEKQRAELAAIIRRNTTDDGSYETAIGSLYRSRHTKSHDFAPVLAQPALCIMAQGRKEVRLADEFFNYDPLNYLVVSVSMPLNLAAKPSAVNCSVVNPNRADASPSWSARLIAFVSPAAKAAAPAVLLL